MELGPSFKLLPDNEIEALIEYVRYLSMRGETEIGLITYAAQEGEVPSIAEIAAELPLVEDEGIPEEPDDPKEVGVAAIKYEWDIAPTKVIQPVTPKVDVNDEQQLAASIERGRDLFFSQAITKCTGCHGEAALGDGTRDYSDWFKWRKDMEQESPEVIQEKVASFIAAGALPPRTLKPRNLRLGVYRGGRRPIDIYRRIFSGIYGSAMPGQGALEGIAGDEVPDDQAGGSISRQEIWDVVNYVLSLPYEPLSKGPSPIEGYDRTLR